MTNEERKVIELALEALRKAMQGNLVFDEAMEAFKSLEKSLAQPEQMPVGKFAKFTDGIWREVTDGSAGVPLYTTPPQRTWVGLTNDEINNLAAGCHLGNSVQDAIYKAIAKLKDKNT